MSGRITSPAWWRIPGGSCASANNRRSLTLQRVLMAKPKAQGAASSSSSSKALSLLARLRVKMRES